ncbi:MAG: hypothetical protein ACJ73J_01990, partial [Actinomycetes bacterium]
MTIELTEDARLTLPRELLVGRIVMIAFLSVLLLREATAGDPLSGAEKATLWALLAVFSLGWIWFWWRLAAGTNYQAIAFTLALVTFS